MLKSLLRDSITYLIPALLSRGLSFFLIPLYSRVLTPKDYGVLDILILFGSIVNLTVSLEVSQGVARYCSTEKDIGRRMLYSSSAFWFTIFCYSLFLFVTLIFTPFLSQQIIGESGLDSIFRIGMIYLCLNGIFLLVHNQFRWELRSRGYAIISFLVSFVTAIISVTLTYFLHWGIAGILLGMIGGIAGGGTYGIWCLRNSFRFQFQGAYLKEMLRFSIPLIPSGIAVFISLYVDRLMINHYFSLAEVGLYGFGFRISSIVGLVMIGFQSALTPLIYRHHDEEKTPRSLAFIFRVFVASALFVFLGLSIFSEELFKLLFAENFLPAKHLTAFMMPTILLGNMYIFAPGIDILKKTHLIFWINLGGAGINLSLNWLMIPHFGIIGAAVATLLGSVFVFITYMSYSQHFYYVPHRWTQLILAVFGTALLVVISLNIQILSYWEIILKIAVVFLEVILLLGLKILTIDDLSGFLGSLKPVKEPQQ